MPRPGIRARIAGGTLLGCAAQPLWRRSTNRPVAQLPQACIPPARLRPVATMISSRAGRSFSTALSVTTVRRLPRRPLPPVPIAIDRDDFAVGATAEPFDDEFVVRRRARSRTDE